MRTPIVAALLVMALGAPAAYAHAHLDHAVPAVGSTVSTAPTEVSLFFTQNPSWRSPASPSLTQTEPMSVKARRRSAAIPCASD